MNAVLESSVASSTASNAASRKAPRLALVDGLRGVAALAVVLFHVYRQNLIAMTTARLPQPLDWLLQHGNAGVFIFFALSGYVIALSVRDRDVTPGFIGRFALRRSLRLDPPYWATIALTIIVIVGSNAMLHDRAPVAVPAADSVVAHVFYLEYFLEYPPILGVFWTLCLELQFYLVLVVVLAIARRIPSARRIEERSLWLFVPLFVASASTSLFTMSTVVGASFLSYWYCFFAGVLACWAPSRVHPVWLFGALLVLIALFAHAPAAGFTCAILTPALLYVGGVRGFLSKGGGRVLQFLGAISYSLYLTHMIAGTRAVRLFARYFGAPLSLSAVVALICIGAGCSIAFAYLFYRVVELPSLRLSRRVKVGS